MSNFSEKEFDVLGFAKSILNEIESIRSFMSLKDDTTKEGFQLPTESRINSFFRLIGLPYFVTIKDSKTKSDYTKFLNPGFGKAVWANLSDKQINNNDKQSYTYLDGKQTNVANAVKTRETLLLDVSQKIGTEEMNQRMVQSIYDPIPIKPNISNYKGRTVLKQLFPLIPNYDKILPLENEIARSFTLDVKERRLDRDTVFRKPFLEQAIRIRFIMFGNSQKENEKNNDFVKSIKHLVGDEQFEKIFKGTSFEQKNILEEYIIIKFFDTIKNLAKRWVKINERDREGLLREIRPTIVIKTGSARVSTFGKRVEISTDLNNTEEGEKIKKLNKAIVEDESLLSLLPSDEDEKTNINDGETRNITAGALQNPFTDLLNYDLKRNRELRDDLVARSDKNIKAIERIRLEIDLMTGEFMGLSLPDVVITIASLFIVDKNKLLNLLDKYTIDNMLSDNVLKAIVKDITPTSENAMEGVNALEKVVEQLFNFFQSEVDKVHSRQNQGRKATSQRLENVKNLNTAVCNTTKE